MIIDCHGHYTTTPPGVGAWRDAQKAAVAADPLHISQKGVMNVSDDEIRESIATNQLKVQQERGTDSASPHFFVNNRGGQSIGSEGLCCVTQRTYT